MPRTRIKICGIRDAVTARVAADAGADAVGLVFAAGSPRLVTMDQALEVIAALPPFVEPIGLFVDSPVERVFDTAMRLGLRTVQLHGSETPGEGAHLTPIRILRAIPATTQAGDTINHWVHHCANLAGILLDAPPAPADTLPGGTGRAWDWTTAADLLKDSATPILLAGGLTPDNVGDAVRQVRPYAVDVSSGVESSRGIKDHDRIRQFCAAVHAADR